MVDSIGPSKIKSIVKSKPLVRGKTEKSERERHHPDKKPKDREDEKKRIGINIDERC